MSAHDSGHWRSVVHVAIYLYVMLGSKLRMLFMSFWRWRCCIPSKSGLCHLIRLWKLCGGEILVKPPSLGRRNLGQVKWVHITLTRMAQRYFVTWYIYIYNMTKDGEADSCFIAGTVIISFTQQLITNCGWINLMQCSSNETDSGQTSEYYATFLSGKKECFWWSVGALVSLFSRTS